MNEILLATGLMTALSGALSVLLLIAERFFADYGECAIDVNQGERTIKAKGGNHLLGTLSEKKLFLPSACGGRGSCGVCKCKVTAGGGPLLPTETPYLNDTERQSQVRLACQVKVKGDIRIEIPEELLAIREYQTTVERLTDLTYDIKGLRCRLPEGERVKFKAGQYVQLVAPPYDKLRQATTRAYSIASAPSDSGAIELIVRLVPNGIATTYVFKHQREGGPQTLIGPYGDFFLRDTTREIVCIAGGSGLAPIRSIVLDMIDRGISNRPTAFFFGARTERDLYYVEEFGEISRQHPWFRFIPALSASTDPNCPYEQGLITDVVKRHYARLDNHEAYLCGSPGMIDACIKTLTAQGMPESLIYYDKFS